MNEIIKKDIISVIKETINILKVKDKSDIIELKKLSSHTNHISSIFQDEDSISIAILIYSLSKTIERKFGVVNFIEISRFLKSAQTNLSKGDINLYRRDIKSLFKLISRIDSKLKLYIEQVVRQAQVKKGSQIYRHGISLERTAEVLGISQWELMSYIGHTSMTDMPSDSVDLRTRLNNARRLFL